MLKTYTREELKQLEGKRVRCKFTYPKNDFTIIWILIIHHNNLHIGGAWAICIKNEYNTGWRNYQFELLENEFEVGELVEVKDNGVTWNKAIYLLTVPWTTNLPYVTVRKSDNEKYRNGEDFAWIPYSQIRKIQPETNPKNIATEEQEKMFYENIVKPYFNIEEKMWFEILEILKKK